MTTTVVMVTNNTGTPLIASLRAVLAQADLRECILVNKNNPPAILARLQQLSLTEPKLKLVKGDSHLSLARAYDYGLEQAENPEHIVFIQGDCLLPPDALKQFTQLITGREAPIIAAPLLQYPNRAELPNARSTVPYPAKPFSKSLVGKTLPTNTQEIPCISAACIAMSRATYERLAPLDQNYAHTAERFDIALKAHTQGLLLLYVPKIRVTNIVENADTVPDFSKHWSYYASIMRLLRSHYHDSFKTKLLVATAHMRLLFDYTAHLGLTLLESKPKSRRSVDAKRLMILANGLAELPQTKELYGKAVLVTGATSQIGLSVVKRLIASGAAVLAVSRNDPIPYRHENLRWIKDDLTAETFHLHGYLVDICVHCAPLWQLPATIDILADAEVKRVIAIGSTSIYSKALTQSKFESKIVERLQWAENEVPMRCERRNINWTILRPTVLYGVGLDESVSFVANFLQRYGFLPVYPPASGKRQPVHVDDVAAAVQKSLNAEASYNKSYNLSGPEILSYREMLERIAVACAKPARIKETTMLPGLLDVYGRWFKKPFINGEIARRMNDDFLYFHDDATKDFGYKPRSFLSDGMKDIEGY